MGYSSNTVLAVGRTRFWLIMCLQCALALFIYDLDALAASTMPNQAETSVPSGGPCPHAEASHPGDAPGRRHSRSSVRLLCRSRIGSSQTAHHRAGDNDRDVSGAHRITISTSTLSPDDLPVRVRRITI